MLYNETKDKAKIEQINATTYQRELELGTQSGIVTLRIRIERGLLSLKVYSDGELIQTTNGFRSENGYIDFFYEAGSTIIVESESFEPDDIWEYEASCPSNPCFAAQSSDSFDPVLINTADLGNESGTVKLDIDITDGSIKTEVFKNGTLIGDTNGFTDKSGYLKFYYDPGDEIVVETERADPTTDTWAYRMSCPRLEKCSYDQSSNNYRITTKVYQTEFDLEYALPEPLDSRFEYRVNLRHYAYGDGSALGLKVYRNGTLVTSTDGLESGFGRLKFRYRKGDNIVVESESSSLDNYWSYTISCPSYHCSFIISSDEYEVTGTSHSEFIYPEGMEVEEGYITTLKTVVNSGALGLKLYMDDELVTDRQTGDPVDTEGLLSEGVTFRFNYYQGRSLRIETNSSSPNDDWEYRLSCPRSPGDGSSSNPTSPGSPSPGSPSPGSPSPGGPGSPSPSPIPSPNPRPDPDDDDDDRDDRDVCPYNYDSSQTGKNERTHSQNFELGTNLRGTRIVGATFRRMEDFIRRGYRQDGIVKVRFNILKGSLGLRVFKNGEKVAETDGLIPAPNEEPPNFDQSKRDRLEFDYVRGDNVVVESTDTSDEDVWSYSISCPGGGSSTPSEPTCPFLVASNDPDINGLINQKELSYASTPEGIITLEYEVTSGSVSLKAIVNGDIKTDTEGMVSGTGSIEFRYNSGDNVVIESESSNESAAWSYTASCVEEIPFAAIINVGYPYVSESQFDTAIIATGYPQVPEGKYDSALIVTGYSQVPESQFDSAIIATGYSQVPEEQFNSAIIATGYSQVPEDLFESAIISVGYGKAPDGYFDEAIVAAGYTYPSYGHFDDAFIVTGYSDIEQEFFDEAIIASGYSDPSYDHFQEAIIATGYGIESNIDYDEAIISIAYTYPNYYHFKAPIVAVGYPVFSHDHFFTDTEFMVAAGYYKR